MPFFDTSAVAYVVRIIPPAQRARAIGYFLLAPSLASAIAASSGVSVFNAYGFTVLLFACSALSLCTFLLSSKLKQEKPGHVVISISHRDNTLFLEPRILAPAMVSFLVFFSWAAVAAFFPLYAVQCGVKNPGIFFSANAATVVIVRLLGGRLFEIFRKEKLIPILIVISMASVVLLSASSTLPMFVLIGLLWGLGSAFLAPLAMAYALEYAGSSDGTAVATYQAFMDLGLALGPAITGIIVPHTGYRVMFLCLALTCLMNLCYFQFYLKKRRTGAFAAT